MSKRGGSDAALAERYRRTYHVEGVGGAEARAHWELEKRLTAELWNSTPANRWETFTRCYTELYRSLPWLNEAADTDAPPSGFAQWAALIGGVSDIFEIGSGRADLLRSLHALGHRCTATEITRERGSKHADDLNWEVTDGIHLADFVEEHTYDIVISTGVIEHFHPDDLPIHFEHARRILRPGGRYLLTTPHIGSGPHDLSVVFQRDHAECMHLKEYDYATLGDMMTAAGLEVSAVFPPSRVFRRVAFTRESRLYLAYLRLFDHDRHLPVRIRRRFRSLSKSLLVPDNIWLSGRRV